MDIKCPVCNSTNISSGNKGFGFGKATIGGLLFGPLGILAGGIGSKRVRLHCNLCGHTWDPKLEYDIEQRKQRHEERMAKYEKRMQRNIEKWKAIGRFLWPK